MTEYLTDADKDFRVGLLFLVRKKDLALCRNYFHRTFSGTLVVVAPTDFIAASPAVIQLPAELIY